jgi:type II secretory pathway component GspD/PulD (secretin)
VNSPQGRVSETEFVRVVATSLEDTTVHIWQKVGYLAATLASSVLAHAQEPRPVAVAYRDADVRTVIQQVGQATNSAVVIGNGVEGTVTFQPSGPMTADEFRTAILSHLADLGYEITERDGALLIGPRKL